MGRKNRANGEGSICKVTRNGVFVGYRASICIDRDENGKLIRKQFTSKTKREVIEKLNNYKAQELGKAIINTSGGLKL